ncbi:hypothetical protein FACS189456_2670 [Bacteroidia bacterium]|nr:hypothetical protein FACS189456_2670 [Bacteroidia bacterium]
MFVSKTILAAVCVVCIPLVQSAQSNASQTSIESVIEELGNIEEAEMSLDVLYETLSNYAQNPLNINAASNEELLQLQLLNEFQVHSLREYFTQYGEMQTPYELQYVQGFTAELMQKLLPFICTLPVEKQDPLSLKRMLTKGHHELLLREKHVVEQQAGYSAASDSLLQSRPNARYAGSKPALYERYRYRYKDNLQWGLTADKDAGEEFFAGSNSQGFDFYSAHLQVSNIGILQNLVVGDFYAQFGQGLSLWQGGRFGKSADAMNIAKRGAGIKAYTGADENNFFRGIATSLKIKQLMLSAFVSYNNKDANVDTAGAFSSRYTTGLHNTAKTIHDKDALQEFVTGLNASYRFKKMQWGATALWHRYNSDYQRDMKPYEKFDLNRNSNFNVSSDFRWYIKKFHFFGEVGMSQNQAGAVLAGMMADIASPVQLSLVYRNYAKNYQAMYANAFAEGSKTANENGVYFGANIYPHRKIKTSFYIDVFHFPWLKFKANSPSKGFDALLQIDYTASHFCQMYLRAKYDTKEENVPNEIFPLKSTADVEKVMLRYNISYRLFDGLNAQSRAEGSLYKAGTTNYEYGIMAFQDIKYTFRQPQVNLSVRYALFNTESYDTRFYAYENDVLNAFSVPAYYGNGSRWYFNVQYSPLERVDIWLRLAQTHYFDRSQIGSGLTLIDAPHQTEFKVQVKIKI